MIIKFVRSKNYYFFIVNNLRLFVITLKNKTKMQNLLMLKMNNYV